MGSAMARGRRNRIGIEHVTLKNEDGSFSAGQQITCDNCGTTAVIRNNKTARDLPMSVVERKFKQMGWQITHRRNWCPACVSKRPGPKLVEVIPPPQDTAMADAMLEAAYESIEVVKQPALAAPQPQEEPMAEPVQISPVVLAGTPSREPTREQKRRIHAEIDGNWDERKGRYMGDMSDQKIADAIGVARVWVEEIRADFFGDSGANEDLEALRSELNVHIGDVEKLVENAVEMAARYERILNDLKGIRARLERVEKSVLPRR